MSLNVVPFVLGLMNNNTYLIVDSTSNQAVVVDPSFDIEILLLYCQEYQINISQVWLTHAHFDHFVGVDRLLQAFPDSQVGLHPNDMFLLEKGGMASIMGIKATIRFKPDLSFKDNMDLNLGENIFTVLHTPGHSPGHVVFYNKDLASVFCGDLIFNQGIGRTDLPGGSAHEIIHSIRNKILILPPQTILYSGHGPKTTVLEETENIPGH